MTRAIQGGLAAIFGLLLIVMPALAHHSSSAEFDVNKEVTMTGIITRVDWINPHTYIFVDVKDSNGKVTNWALETWPTGILHRFGIKKEMFVVGQTMEVVANPAKDETRSLGYLRHIKFQNGDEIKFQPGVAEQQN